MLKKYSFFAFVLCCVILLASCTSGDGGKESGKITENGTDVSAPDNTEENAQTESQNEYEDHETVDIEGMLQNEEVLLVRYISNSLGISTKPIKGNYASALVNAVSSLDKTGEKCDKISDQEFSFDHTSSCLADVGTYWLRIKETIYRITPECDEICLVSGYYGEGEVLQADKDLFNLILSLWEYYPRNTQIGEFSNGTLSVNTALDIESDISILVKDITIGKADPNKATNLVTLEISSKNGCQDLLVEAIAQKNENEYAASSETTVNLSADSKKEITLTFGGWNEAYALNVVAAESRVIITINP